LLSSSDSIPATGSRRGCSFVLFNHSPADSNDAKVHP